MGHLMIYFGRIGFSESEILLESRNKGSFEVAETEM